MIARGVLATFLPKAHKYFSWFSVFSDFQLIPIQMVVHCATFTDVALDWPPPITNICEWNKLNIDVPCIHALLCARRYNQNWHHVASQLWSIASIILKLPYHTLYSWNILSAVLIPLALPSQASITSQSRAHMDNYTFCEHCSVGDLKSEWL